jgi:flagellar biosynthesis component FlhA
MPVEVADGQSLQSLFLKNEWIKSLQEIRETRNLTIEVREENKLARQIAQAAEKKTEAAWELVVMTRNQLSKPFWKRWFGY